VNTISQVDPPRLTLVSSAAQPVHQPTEAIDTVRFLQAMTVSLDLDEVLETLNDFLRELVDHSGWEYRHAEYGCEFSGGTPDRHRLEYDLTLNGQEMGILKLMRGRRFSEKDQMRIESLLGLAAQSLRNALRFFETAQQLERDPLTGLGNRRAFNMQGGQWLADSVRHRHPIALLVMDLDRFKGVNDTYGHPVGDQLLRAVADTLTSVTRTADLCVRMGGDEFAVLLPGTDLSAAMECAERIRLALVQKSVVTPTGETVTGRVSIGVAAYRAGMDLDQLYLQADDALYAAKRAGSNRVLAGVGHLDGPRSEPLGIFS